jgi:hypothetical protein
MREVSVVFRCAEHFSVEKTLSTDKGPVDVAGFISGRRRLAAQFTVQQAPHGLKQYVTMQVLCVLSIQTLNQLRAAGLIREAIKKFCKSL